MGKSKVTFEWNEDYKGRQVLIVKRKNGQLTYRDVVEALTDSGKFCGMNFLMSMRISDELPDDLYDKGDVWILYEPDDFFGKTGTNRLIPLKPLLTSRVKNKWIGTCPCCGSDVKKAVISDMYCTCCGQELDWSEEQDV